MDKKQIEEELGLLSKLKLKLIEYQDKFVVEIDRSEVGYTKSYWIPKSEVVNGLL